MEDLAFIEEFPDIIKWEIVKKLQESWAVEVHKNKKEQSWDLFVDAQQQDTWDAWCSDNLLFVQLATHWKLVDRVFFTTYTVETIRSWNYYDDGTTTMLRRMHFDTFRTEYLPLYSGMKAEFRDVEKKEVEEMLARESSRD